MLSPEAQARLATLRQKARDNTLTKEECAEAIAMMRQERVAASATSAASKARKSTAAAKKNVNSDDLLSELDGL
jgi:hypothetical protein